MIIRARPKFFEPHSESGGSLSKGSDVYGENDHLYFNTGRSALKFVLQWMSIFYDIKIKILMQSFNCRVVADAAIEADADVVLCDIDLDFFSISYDILKNVDTSRYNVLLLTHYQGIPNFDYNEIIDYCKVNDIFVIEDLAQTYGSKIDGCHVGAKGDISLHSYAFDKPFSVYQGGSIKINNSESKFSNFLFNKYVTLPTEDYFTAKNDIRMLNYLFHFSDKNRYHKSINDYDLTYSLLKWNLDERKIFAIQKYMSKFVFIKRVFNFFSRLIWGYENSISIIKMHKIKISEIQRQSLNFKCSSDTYYSDKVTVFDLAPVSHSFAEICWNRYSILDVGDNLKNHLIEEGIECGNYNWRTPLHKLFYNHKQVFIFSRMTNSDHASKHILNIPIWHLV